MNPLTPDDFKALIPSPNGNMCDELKKSQLQFPEAFWIWYNWAFTADGEVSTEYATTICTALGLIGCTGGGTTASTTAGTGSTTASTTPAAPAVVWAVTADNGGGTTNNKFMTLDLATGVVSIISTAMSYYYCIGEDPTSGILYGFVANGSNNDFVSVDKTTGAETVIAASVTMTAGHPVGMAFNSSGICYITIQGGASAGAGCANTVYTYTVNLTTGVITAVGSPFAYWGVSEIAFIGSTLYGVGQDWCQSDKRLCTINTTTGAVTTVIGLTPFEVPSYFDKLAYVNSILYKVEISQISQVNITTGAVVNIATFNNTTNGRIRGMAKLQ